MKRTLPVALLSSLMSVVLAGCTGSAHDAATEAAAGTGASAKLDNRAALDAAIAGSVRDQRNVTRDPYRHPAQTLAFFGVSPKQTVIEITPGAGWYSEILAPYLKDGGHYVAAVWDDAIAGQPKYRYDLNKTLRDKFAGNTAAYGMAELRVFDPKAPNFGPVGSADTVLTFRNAHNWVSDGTAEAYFKAFYDALKPGGTLGLVDHRAKPGADLEAQKKSGYLTEALVIQLAQGAGFVLEEKSEVNANAKDTTDHPNGVWTLPPVNRHDAADDAKYKAMGESDRMTLRFRKAK